MESTAIRTPRPLTADRSGAPGAAPGALAVADWSELPAARRVSLLRLALAVSGILAVPEIGGPLAVVMLLFVLHGLLAHWAASRRHVASRARAWHWIDLGWGLAIVAASGAHGFAYLFFVYPIVVASVRSGTAEGAAVTLAALVGWLAIAVAQGAQADWGSTLLRAASLAILGYAIALAAGPAAGGRRRLTMLAATAVDSERRRISLDLHDGAIQPYLGLKLGLEALRRKLKPGNALAQDIDELYRMTQESIAELRGYVHVLRGQGRGRATGLADALRRQIERFGHFYALEVDFQLQCDPALGAALVDELVQMLAEGLSNIGRHTAARHATVTLAANGREIIMRIVDGGGRRAPWRRFTPVSLTLRARRLGGRVEVMPHPGGGSEVRIHLPI